MAPPLTGGPQAPPRRLLQAAAGDDLDLFKRIASALDAGKGRLRESVEAVRDRGAGALHLATGRGRMKVCAYLVEELHVDVNTVDESGCLFVSLLAEMENPSYFVECLAVITDLESRLR
ncbi:hypothetical protein PR202_ga00771 [Eleusine coracana subsp. coracana]|uniref:Uncharacterized protein n=1 Tax=Eleusine coracana subsp. coracana TaxID=191504 RepID=A0AAV5BHD3_ELECO|nr:hypothetical protein PR202_ga00771 [Eleusine coracana subsp. coracana]